MIKVFNGNWRGPGDKKHRIGMILEFSFRNILHQFKGAKLAIFLAIALHADENGVSYPSYDLLEKETGYNRASVARALKELCESSIEGKPILIRFRTRDEEGRYTGSNRYLIFPTNEEVQSIKSELWTSIQSSENPTLDKSNGGKSELEVKPSIKVKPEIKRGATVLQQQDAVIILSNASGLVDFPRTHTEYKETVLRLAEKYGVDETTEAMRRACQQWIKTRGKNGRTYFVTNLGWIDWAQVELMGGELPSSEKRELTPEEQIDAYKRKVANQ